MNELAIDLETRSSIDLTKSGVYKYCESPDFDILLFGVSIDHGPVKVYDLVCGDVLPDEIINGIVSKDVIKYAHNSAFERVAISCWLRPHHPERFEGYGDGLNFLDPVSWRCTMVLAAYNGLPLSLAQVGAALKLDQQKMKEGRDLIRYFCTPSRTADRAWNLPEHAPEKWELFKKYNVRDVETEMAIADRLKNYPVPDSVWDEYRLSEEINDRGIMIDRTLVEKAVWIDGLTKAALMEELQKRTGLDNPNSVTQLKSFLTDHGVEAESLGKKDVAALMQTVPEDIKEVLALRLQLAKSSVKKYQAMENAVCNDDRCRGMFLFYGANRTGRYSGRIIQLQNLYRNKMPDLEAARELVRQGDYEMLSMLYASVPEVLAELVRTAFIPAPGMKFVVADFSAIEARVLSYLAGEQWRIDVFHNGRDIYCESASRMFNCVVEKHGQNGHLRQKGKIAELACIAEGQPVLTDHGLIPIEKITPEDRLWDGKEWVTHDGVIFRGEREVISYEGLTATPDHLVFVEGKSEPIQFGFAAASGAHLVQTGPGKSEELAHHKRTARLYDIRNAGRHHRFTVSGVLVHNCGYGGSVGAMKAMGGLEMGLSEDELQNIVSDWRSANPHIVQYWWDVDRAVKTAIKQRTITKAGCVRFECRNGMLFAHLPSGRRLSYVKPRIGENQFGGESVTYLGLDSTKHYSRIESYGPKYVENIVQAVSRDILVYAMKALREYRIVAHVHDEIIIECPMDTKVGDICDVMSRTPHWLPGIELKADGYECGFYMKDG